MKFINTLVVGILLVGLMSVAIRYVPNVAEVNKIETEEVIKEVQPDWATDEEAVKAAQDVIRRKELQAELDTVESEIEALKARQTELTKELGTYWTVKANILNEIRKTFPESPETAVAVANCESSFRMVQSNHMQPYGREESWGIFQIHAKAWEHTAQAIGLADYKTNIEQNIKMARHVYEQSGWRAWTCYNKQVAMR